MEMDNDVMPEKIPITLDAAYLAPEVTPPMVAAWRDRLSGGDRTLTEGTGAGSDFRGWLDPADMTDEALLTQIEQIAADLRQKSDTLVVIGIGGSYLGARAVIEALAPASAAASVVYAGQNLSARYHRDLLDSLAGKRVALNAVSKSGTTTEPAVAFRLLRAHLEQQVGAEKASELTVATTDEKKGALRQVSVATGYRTLPIAEDVGGRYSVLSPVGLLPIAYAGIDIRALRQGAIDCAAAAAKEADPRRNPILFYAAARNILYNQGTSIEVLASFEPRLHYLLEWWKQLFGESEGKDHMALFPASVEFTTDLHSMGQYLQQGRRSLLETFLIIDGGEPELPLPPGDEADELNYLTGRPLTEINRAAYQATALAHREGGVPNLTLRLSELNAYSLGALLYFFERACGVSGYLLGVNPFDQPGVEAYKKNMFALLQKPGFEKETERLREKVGQAAEGSVIAFG